MIVEIFLSGAGGAIVGAIIGAIVGAYAQHKFSDNALKRAAKERDQTIYKLLRYEISQNLDLLNKLWREKINSLRPDLRPRNYGYFHEEVEFVHRFSLIQESLPSWHAHTWESQRTAISSILITDERFGEVSGHYTNLNRLAAIRSSLTSAIPEELIQKYQIWVINEPPQIEKDPALKASLSSISIQAGPDIPAKTLPWREGLRHYNNETFTLWAECEGIFNSMLSKGNPLPEEMPHLDRKPGRWAKLGAGLKQHFFIKGKRARE